jgi:hypothetical protein
MKETDKMMGYKENAYREQELTASPTHRPP